MSEDGWPALQPLPCEQTCRAHLVAGPLQRLDRALPLAERDEQLDGDLRLATFREPDRRAQDV